jgi:hypothetical protein
LYVSSDFCYERNWSTLNIFFNLEAQEEEEEKFKEIRDTSKFFFSAGWNLGPCTC